MKIHHHTAVSAIISVSLYLTFRSWGLAAACFISGIFVDLDHIVDYLREHGRPFRLSKFFHVCHTCQFERIMLLLHGWEWLGLWALTAWYTGWNPWVTGTLIGLGQHMVLDVLYNSQDLKSYSLLWRWKQDFDFNVIFGKRFPRCQ